MRLPEAVSKLIDLIPGMSRQLDAIASGVYSAGDVSNAVNTAHEMARVYCHIATGAAEHPDAYAAIMAMNPDISADFLTSYGAVKPLFTAWLDVVAAEASARRLDVRRALEWQDVGTVPDGQGGTVTVQARRMVNEEFDPSTTTTINGAELTALRTALAALMS